MSTDNSERTAKLRIENLRHHHWKPGQSGNPGGRPKNDWARAIAQAIFEGNEEAIYNAMAKALLRGNAYAFKELAERAYGKITEHHEISEYREPKDQAELSQRIAQLERDLGYAAAIDEAGTALNETDTREERTDK